MFEEIRPKRGPDGREGRTALPVSPRLKAILAATGVLACLVTAAAAWWWTGSWVTWALLGLAVVAAADAIWQWRRHRRAQSGNPQRKEPPP